MSHHGLHVHPHVHASEVVSHVIELGHLKPAVARALRLLLETAIVPTMLLYLCMLTVRRIPGTLMLCIAMLVGRTSIALALSSVYVYLLQPVAGSVLMAGLFIGSALLGRPITMRLAQDFVHMPVRLVADRRCRRMFVQVSLLWGVSRLLDAGMSIGVLHWGLAAGIFSRGIFSGMLTALSVLACAYWGWSRLRRIPGVEFRLGGSPASA